MTIPGTLPAGRLLTARVLLVACTGREGAARDKFEKASLCPTERITVSKIENMTLHELKQRLSPDEVAQAPADIQNDPARLSVWQKQQDEQAHTMRWVDGRFDLYRISGCDHETIYACEFLRSERGPWRGRCMDTPAGALDMLRGVRWRSTPPRSPCACCFVLLPTQARNLPMHAHNKSQGQPP